MTKFHAILTAGAALIAAPAIAQEAAPAPAQAPQAAPAAPAAPGAPVTASDAEITSFAKAAIAVDKVNKDTALPDADKPKKLAEVVTAAGIQPTRFNEIAVASGSDAALQQRIQAAIVAEQNAAAPAAPATPAQ
ncbi:DUF4168 domain-containing protein [Sphingomonas turrisvirgatae]|uniref:DUF4168 domain-containing protein n=1 Tax=Sphingomonas turrisvirgatae TaxID=1888892 RepID=A0A1E3M3J9_9SPHN|nr:DUF4168 domain-containing protein [Sphingomonas turrisvirgatae]ODP39650.1 hypothetical protein BFL28_08405 [Sphingomonas turrisvirgatae]